MAAAGAGTAGCAPEGRGSPANTGRRADGTANSAVPPLTAPALAVLPCFRLRRGK